MLFVHVELNFIFEVPLTLGWRPLTPSKMYSAFTLLTPKRGLRKILEAVVGCHASFTL